MLKPPLWSIMSTIGVELDISGTSPTHIYPYVIYRDLLVAINVNLHLEVQGFAPVYHARSLSPMRTSVAALGVTRNNIIMLTRLTIIASLVFLLSFLIFAIHPPY